jgi:hypothetical protein
VGECGIFSQAGVVGSYAFDMVDFSRIDGFPVHEVHDNVSYASIIMKIFMDTRNADDVWIKYSEYLILIDCFSFSNCSAKFDHLRVQYDDFVAKIFGMETTRDWRICTILYDMLPRKVNSCHNGGCKTELSGLKKAAQGMGLCEREEGLLGIRSLNFRPEYGWGNLGAVHSSVGVARQP